MTAVDDRAIAVRQDQSARNEDFYTDLLPEAAQLVVLSGLGSARMLQRKMRLPHAVILDLMVELRNAEVLGDANADGSWPCLVEEGDLNATLARIATLATGEDKEPAKDVASVAPEGVADAPPVSLTKPPPPLARVPVEDATGEEWGHEAAPSRQAPGVAEWVRWHLVELAAVAAPVVAAVMVHPGWWLAAAGVGARWAALEWRAHRHHGGQS